MLVSEAKVLKISSEATSNRASAVVWSGALLKLVKKVGGAKGWCFSRKVATTVTQRSVVKSMQVLKRIRAFLVIAYTAA